MLHSVKVGQQVIAQFPDEKIRVEVLEILHTGKIIGRLLSDTLRTLVENADARGASISDYTRERADRIPKEHAWKYGDLVELELDVEFVSNWKFIKLYQPGD